jgi:hypothetical protein
MLVEDVQVAVLKFPDGIRRLFEDRGKRINLTEEVIGRSGQLATREFLAARIHAGIEENIRNTRICLTPPVQRFLTFYFLPLMEYLDEYDRRLVQDNNAREYIFEGIIVKWFQTVFVDPTRTFQGILDEFCPSDSSIAGDVIILNRSKLKCGYRIVERDDPSTESTVSVKNIASELRSYLDNGEIDIYFPAGRSQSPDIIIIPPLEKDKVIIGVQVKCIRRNDRPIGKQTLDAEIRRFSKIIGHIRRKKGYNRVKAVLIMCATCPNTMEDFPAFHTGAKSFLWKNKSRQEIEVIIINLSTPELRKKFFGLAIDARSLDRAADVIERTIIYSPRIRS